MKKSKLFSLIIYAAILILAFSWVLGIFGGAKDDLSYSQVVALFNNQQVKSFVVEENEISLKLHSEFNGKTELTASLADPEGFRSDMWQLFQKQAEDGVLESLTNFSNRI